MTIELFADILRKLAQAFPEGGYLTANGEFIANKRIRNDMKEKENEDKA